jgi:hypothetical protein
MPIDARRNGDTVHVRRWIVRGARRWSGVALALFALGACGPAQGPPGAAAPAAPAADGWHEFQGSWVAAGMRHTIPFGENHRAGIVNLEGTLLLAGPSRPGVGFRAQAIALADPSTGVIGRAVWTDEKGDQVYSELRGTGTVTGSKVEGTFVGGTGRYAGATGTYEFSWQYVIHTDDGTMDGRASGLKGRIRVAADGQPSPTGSGAKQ